ncbi:AraC family transcriptional regulator [Sphingomonas faeni]|uniref:AraC family transcriptional regulator n=1 Tax=Sphingomonas faeni TaxID=185950 RepID=UPI0033473F09
MRMEDQSGAKYGGRDILESSVAGGWRGLAADHRHHPKGEVGSFQPANLEIAIATACNPACVVSRTGDRIRQHTRVEAGTIWFCPTGVEETDIIVSEWHDALHIYLPSSAFADISDARGGAACRPEGVPYLGGFFDERLRRLGAEVLRELVAPSAASTVLVDTLSIALTRCVIATYSGVDTGSEGRVSAHRLDDRRLRRVLDYMTAHLEDDVGLTDLADAACLSVFHFIRLFTSTTGLPPHRYLSRLRLERAKTLLSLRTMPIAEIAQACRFSSQSAFTRAFRHATATTPQVYRRQS